MTRPCPHCSALIEESDTVCPSCERNAAPIQDETLTVPGSADVLGESGVDAAALAETSRPETALDEELDVSQEAAPEAAPLEARDAAPTEVPEPEIRFDAHEEPHFDVEPSVLEDAHADHSAPTPGARYVVFRCERCQMPMAPGTTACLRCGLQRTQPVPNIPIHASQSAPTLRQGEYHCPECQAVLAPQSNLCTNCGAEFVSAVPPVNWGTPGAGATGGNAALWTRPRTGSGPETWKIVAAVIAVVAFVAVLLMIGALSAGQEPTETDVTTGTEGSPPIATIPPTPILAPVVMSPGTGGANGNVHASPVGTWVKGRNSIRLDEIGGAWVDAPGITGTKSKVNLNWTLVDTPTGPVVHVQGPGYLWDFAWNFGSDGSETLTQTQWGELKKLPDGSKPGGTKAGSSPGAQKAAAVP